MSVSFVNKTKSRVNSAMVRRWINKLEKELPLIKGKDLTIAFVSAKTITELNGLFRSKKKVTDILSFGSRLPDQLGELAICLIQVKYQAKERGHSINFELSYLILHGILHLLGYNHENGGLQAKKMFKIQDDIFKRLYPSR